MSNTQIEAIERNIRNSKGAIELGNAVERLRTNKDFRKVVMEGYFEKEAIRLVHLKSDPAMQGTESQQSITTQMDAIGNMSQYMNTVLQKAALAGKSLESDEETLVELSEEGLSHE